LLLELRGEAGEREGARGGGRLDLREEGGERGLCLLERSEGGEAMVHAMLIRSGEREERESHERREKERSGRL